MNEIVKGYKVFRFDWTCRDKQYACPGKFEEDINVKLCESGMHFCKQLYNCFNYYEFNPKNKVAEVIAYGDVECSDKKCCTNKLEIVRELSWEEVLKEVNIGYNCDGRGNIGDYNYGNGNLGWSNVGNMNIGEMNNGDANLGSYNFGEMNVGSYNTGKCNVGDFNRGKYNTGKCNTGDYNTGNYNSGDLNTGDWNTCDFSAGCFNTIDPTIRMFNKPTDWTLADWLTSTAYKILDTMPMDSYIRFINSKFLTEEEIEQNPEVIKTTEGLLKEIPTELSRQTWWEDLHNEDKKEIMSLPNFDKEIFKEITGIDVD